MWNINLKLKKNMKTFKNWFSLMWGDWQIQRFCLGIILIVLVNIFDPGEGYWIFTGIGVAIMGVTAYLGFYKFWNRNKHLYENDK